MPMYKLPEIMLLCSTLLKDCKDCRGIKTKMYLQRLPSFSSPNFRSPVYDFIGLNFFTGASDVSVSRSSCGIRLLVSCRVHDHVFVKLWQSCNRMWIIPFHSVVWFLRKVGTIYFYQLLSKDLFQDTHAHTWTRIFQALRLPRAIFVFSFRCMYYVCKYVGKPLTMVPVYTHCKRSKSRKQKQTRSSIGNSHSYFICKTYMLIH